MVAATDIEVRHLDGGNIAYQQFHGTIPSIETATSSVRSWVITMGYKPEGPMAVEVEGEPSTDLSQEYDIEVQLPVGANARADPSDHVQIKPFAPTDAVVMTLRGPYELINIGEPLARLREWIGGHNLQTTNVVRWVEVTDPAMVSPSDQITELQYLVKGQ